MSRLPKADDVLLIVASDLHLSHTPPKCRDVPVNWYDVQQRYLEQLQAMKNEYDCPVVYPGDLFNDGWRPHRCPPELVNFAMTFLPFGHAIPGQHDLPHHRYEDLHKSAYWTLFRAGLIESLSPGVPVRVKGRHNLWLHGWPWGFKVEAPRDDSGDGQNYGYDPIHVAVVHDMVWAGSPPFPGAPGSKALDTWLYRLRGYDAACFGDNHSGFHRPRGRTWPAIVNPGTFMRRTVAERDYQPCVGLVYHDGGVKVKRVPLDCSKDAFADPKTKPDSAVDASDFTEELAELGDAFVNFGRALRRRMRKKDVPDGARQVLQEGLENARG